VDDSRKRGRRDRKTEVERQNTELRTQDTELKGGEPLLIFILSPVFCLLLFKRRSLKESALLDSYSGPDNRA
jgi:hypothetical protein